jgi:hypothetical protein
MRNMNSRLDALEKKTSDQSERPPVVEIYDPVTGKSLNGPAIPGVVRIRIPDNGRGLESRELASNG